MKNSEQFTAVGYLHNRTEEENVSPDGEMGRTYPRMESNSPLRLCGGNAQNRRRDSNFLVRPHEEGVGKKGSGNREQIRRDTLRIISKSLTVSQKWKGSAK